MKRKISDETFNYVFDSNMNKFNWKEEPQITTCGSQLVGMLEEYDDRLTICFVSDIRGKHHSMMTHPPIKQKEKYDYSLEFIDWLCEKNKRTYYGLTEDFDKLIDYNRLSGNNNDTVFWKLFDFKNIQSMKEIILYG